MNRLFVVCIAFVVGVFAITQSIALISAFDYYFYLVPFGMAFVGLFLTAGMMRLPSFALTYAGLAQSLPILGMLAMLTCVALYLYAASFGGPVFFLLLIVLQLVTYVAFWSAIVKEKHSAWAATGVMLGLVIGYVSVGYLSMDPLVILLIACVFAAAVYITQFLKRLQGVAYILIVCLVALAVFQGKPYQITPDSLGWGLDHGKVGSEKIDRNNLVKTWGPAGVSEMYNLNTDERAAWLYTNGSSPGLVLTDELAHYNDAWWAQKAPLAMAIHDAVEPASIIDIGMVPSDMAWRSIGQSGRNVYGLYGSHDWSRLSVPGLDVVRKSVTLLERPRLSAEEKVKSPVDMIVLSSGHEGKQGWVSSNGGEQTFLNQENIQSYWQGLDDDGVLVLFSRQEAVFLKQLFSVWTALNNGGMPDEEFLDRVWGVVPDTAASDSPYRYALVITRKARDEKFAQAIRSQVLKLPVRYLFGYDIQPSAPYNVLYRNDRAGGQAIFTRAASQMFRKNSTFEVSDSRKSIPYQFVEDVFPPYKNMLVLSVGTLIGIVLFSLQKSRRPEDLQTSQGPSVAVWLVTGGATGGLVVAALAFLVACPSSIPQGFRLLYLVALLFIAMLMYVFREAVTIAKRTVLLLAFVSALTLILYVTNRLMQMTVDDSNLLIAVTGIVFVSLLVSLPVMESGLARHAESALVGWWWFAMAAGSAAALFWSMRLYAAWGDGLLLIAGLLLMGIAGVFWWHGHSPLGELRERGAVGGSPV